MCWAKSSDGLRRSWADWMCWKMERNSGSFLEESSRSRCARRSFDTDELRRNRFTSNNKTSQYSYSERETHHSDLFHVVDRKSKSTFRVSNGNSPQLLSFKPGKSRTEKICSKTKITKILFYLLNNKPSMNYLNNQICFVGTGPHNFKWLSVLMKGFQFLSFWSNWLNLQIKTGCWSVFIWKHFLYPTNWKFN